MAHADPRFHCPRCAASTPVEAPTLGDRALFVGVVGTVAAVLIGAPMIGVGLVMIAPVLLFVGLGVGPVTAAAFARPLCARCGCAVERISEASARQPAAAAQRAV